MGKDLKKFDIKNFLFIFSHGQRQALHLVLKILILDIRDSKKPFYHWGKHLETWDYVSMDE